MRILIEGGNFVNKGAEAMVRTVQAEMAARFEGATFHVEAGTVKAGTWEQTEAAGLGILHSYGPHGRVRKADRLLRLALGNPGDARSLWRGRQTLLPWDALLDRIDMIVDVSGLRYSDDMTPANSARNAPLMEQARRRGKPYILLPQSFGPFRRGGKQESICRRCLPSVPMMFARDAESRRHLASLLGRDPEEIPLAPDIAFNFRPAGKEEGLRLLGEMGLGEGGRPIVCIAPNMKVYERVEGYGPSCPYLATLSRLARRFAEDGIDVLMMPHEVKPVPRDTDDDRILCELIRLSASAGLGGSAGRIASVTRPMPAEQMKAMIGRCELLIGSRFHALIAALQSRVPVVAIGWSHKYLELLRDVGLDRFVIGHSEAETGAVSEAVEEAWRGRDANRRTLEEQLPSIEAASAAVFDRVREYVVGERPAVAGTGSAAAYRREVDEQAAVGSEA